MYRSSSSIILAALLLIGTISCSSQGGDLKSAHHLSDDSGYVQLPLLSFEKLCSGITMTEPLIDTLGKENCAGLNLSTYLNIADSLLQALNNNGFNAMYLNLKCIPEKGKEYTSLSHERTMYKQVVNSNRGHYISGAGERSIRVFIPFNALMLQKGMQRIELNLELLPAKFESDSSGFEMRKLLEIRREPIATKKIEVGFNAPQLVKVDLSVEEFELNTDKVDPGKFDFSFGGPGLPELYWDLHCGDQLIYRSRFVKNAVRFPFKLSAPTFYCSQKDLITINIMEHDYGPFNRDDLIDTWSGTIDALPIGKGKLAIDLLKELRVMVKRSPKDQ